MCIERNRYLLFWTPHGLQIVLPNPITPALTREAGLVHSGIPTLFGPGQKGIREQPVGGDDRVTVSLRGHTAAGALYRNVPMPCKEHYLPVILPAPWLKPSAISEFISGPITVA